MFPQSHFPENAFSLKLFLQKAESLIYVIVANQNLQFQLLALRPRY